MSEPAEITQSAEEVRAGAEAAERERRANMLTLEVAFLILVGLVVLVAFFEALTYKLVSSRTPFVIMVPLFVLIAVHAGRLYRRRDEAAIGARVRRALAGKMPGLNKVMLLTVCLVLLLLVILGLGHYIGIGVFSFALMWRLGGVPALKALLVSLGTLVAIFVVFELAFDLELYRGLLFRWMAGYRDF